MSKKIKNKNGNKSNMKKNSKDYERGAVKNFADCVSEGDKIVEIKPVEDKQGKWQGMIFRNGTMKNGYIVMELKIKITALDFGRGETRDEILDDLIESDYILCFNEEIARYIMDIKCFAASIGVKMGEVFFQ